MNDESTTPADGVPENDSPDEFQQAPANDLNTDELAAFEKIMGDIEGQGSPMGDGGVINENHEDAHIPQSPNSEPHPSGKDDDGLDADQQKAFESIMAQIEGPAGAGRDAGSGQTKGTAPEPVDDFSAELERVVQEAEAAEKGGPQNAQSEDSEDALDTDQQKAFESIMAQIEGRQPEKKAPAIPASGPVDEKMEAQALRPDVTATVDTGAVTEDISDDIEDILKEIAASDDAPPLPGTVEEPRVAATVDVDVPKDAPGTSPNEDRPPEQDVDALSPPPSVQSGAASNPQARPSADDLPGPAPADMQPASEDGHGLLTVEPLRAAGTSIRRINQAIVITSLVVVACLALVGYFHWTPKWRNDLKAHEFIAEPTRADVMAETPPLPRAQGALIDDPGSSDRSRLKTAAESLDRLRNQLLEKQAEIEELRAYYQAGIDAEINGVITAIRKAGRNRITFGEAMADPHISLGLAAIQRRDGYIKKLAVPSNDLFWSSEEVLFYSRKAGFLALMAGQTSDIDIDGFIRQTDQITEIHGSVLAQMYIDEGPTAALKLESIWQDIERRLVAAPIQVEDNPAVVSTDNATIWKNICNGDYKQKHMLTELSPEAARCLANWQGKDLFLNALTELEADAARQLVTWDGEWLGLNGLKELSPDAAMHLSRWKGKKMSLNGLSRLSPRVVAILSEWQGDQIELVNVQHMAHWENPKTRLYYSEDLKRKHMAIRK